MSEILHLTALSYETQLTQKWLDGQAHGVEAAVRRFKELAAKFFQEGQDAKARQFRDELPVLLKALQKELEGNADQYQRDHVDPLPPVVSSDDLVKAVLRKAAEEVMDEDSWPSRRSYEEFRGGMSDIADNVRALAVDPADLLKTEPP